MKYETTPRKQDYTKCRLENDTHIRPATNTDSWLAEFIVTISQSDVMVLDKNVAKYSKARYTALAISSGRDIPSLLTCTPEIHIPSR